MNKYFLVILMFYLSTSFAYKTNSNLDLDIYVGKLPTNYILELNILSPENQSIWKYYSNDKNKSFDTTFNNWYSNEGNYKLEVNIRHKDSLYPVQNSIEFYITGKENFVKANVWLIETRNKECVSDIHIKRYHYSSDSVFLRERWVPKPDSMPEYIIQNNSQRKIYGTGLWGNFFGWIEKFNSGKWEEYERGGFCGTVSGGDPIYPRGSDFSIEGYFIGGAKPFTKGKYKYCVNYSFDEMQTIFEIIEKKASDSNLSDLHLLEKEFEIK